MKKMKKKEILKKKFQKKNFWGEGNFI